VARGEQSGCNVWQRAAARLGLRERDLPSPVADYPAAAHHDDVDCDALGATSSSLSPSTLRTTT
jgi:hypothetical protein